MDDPPDEPPDTDPSSVTRDGLGGAWRTLRQKWWARWAIDLTLAVALFWAISHFQTRNLVESGERLPDAELASTDGRHRSLADPEADRTLLYVWATWCGVCDVETGTVQWASSMLPADVSVRSVVFDYQSPAHARQSAADKSIDFPVLLGTPSVRRALAVDAFPTFYVLDREGRVVRRTQGYTTTFGLLWRAWL